ncbi:hypothetical protein APHAL10511_006640 [Amanita phalloides]|nr:hypothetical protein APHAL10511_006640 [Amanita phalloides]
MDKDKTVIGVIEKTNGVYKTEHTPSVTVALANNGTGNKLTLMELHERMGHIATSTLKLLLKKGAINGFEVIDFTEKQCPYCELAKPKVKSVPTVQEGEHKTVFGDEIHSDLWGPARKETLGGRTYYVSFMDDWSSVERNVIFSKLPEVFDLIEPDVRGSEEQSSDVDVDQETRVEEAADDTQSINAEMTNVKVNSPVNPTLPELRRSMRNKKPSQYIQDLKSGEFTTGLHGQTVPNGDQSTR